MRLTTYAANANAARIPASIGKRATFSNSQKLALIQRYAPYIWFSYGQDDVPERFWPSSVEWAFNYRTNFPPNMRNGLERWQNRENDGGNWWLRTQFDIDPATGEWPLFYGDLASSRIYAFWREKNSIADERTPVFDLVYFMFFPYNRGKEVAGSVYGNHVGDWEHVTVRTFGGVAAAIHSEAHGGSGTNRNWNIQPKHPGTDYPVVYCAWGSHGFYLDAGIYNYGPWPELIDICLPYGSWASGNPVSRIEAFDFNAHARLGDPRPYPRWLDTDYTSAGDCDPYFPGGGPDPSCASGGGPITHWGNEGKSAGLLADGPTGPADKNALKNENVFE